MIGYASQTCTRRNLDALRAAGWRLLLSRAAQSSGGWQPFGFRYCLDNGRWADFQEGLRLGRGESMPFDEPRQAQFEQLLDLRGAGCDFVILPDTVAGGMASLEMSVRWSNRVLSAAPLALIPVQDGMEPTDLAPLVGPSVGIFLGGSTEWKLARMADWGQFCADHGVYYHIGRVNTGRRFKMAHAAGAHSVDGSSATRYAKTLPLLDGARRQPDMFAPVGAS